MKKMIALVLAFCMMLTVLPVFAESEEDSSGDSSGLQDLLSGLMGDTEGDGNTEGGLNSILAGLTNLLNGSDGKLASLISKLGDLLKGGKNSIAQLFSALTSKVTRGSSGELDSVLSGLGDLLKIGDIDLNGLLESLTNGASGLGDLLGGLLGDTEGLDLNSLLGSSGEEGTETELSAEDQTELDDLLEKLSKAEETGGHPINKKEATSLEEFYGDWLQTIIYIGEEKLDVGEATDGVHFEETRWYFTTNGEIDTSYDFPETLELKIEDGELLVQDGEGWTNFVLTEEDQLVLGGQGTVEIIYERAK